MKNTVPRLDTAGAITDTLTQIDLILAYCFAADKKQSILYNDVVSFVDFLSDISSSPIELSNKIKSNLKNVFNKYFGNDKVDISTNIQEIVEKSQYIINLTITVTETFQKINSSVYIKNGKFEQIVKKSN